MTTIGPKVPFKVKATFSWSGEKEFDLGFLENDIIEVTKVKGNWLFGKLLRNKKTGYFPINYVKIIETKYNEFNGSGTCKSNSQKQKQKQKVPVPSTSKQPIEGYTPVSVVHTRSIESSSKRGTKYIDKYAGSSQKPCSEGNSTNYSRSSQSHSTHLSQRNQGHKSSKDSSRSLNSGFRKQQIELPPLPPIPLIAQNKSNIQGAISTKSYSYNDLSSKKFKDYYLTNRDFYDGYTPSVSEDSTSTVFPQSRYLEESMTSSEDSFALMSDFSATSAGSFARHRFARSFGESMDIQPPLDKYSTDKNLHDSGGRINDFFKKFAHYTSDTKRVNQVSTDYPKLPDLENLNISKPNDEASSWLEAKSHLHRALTLSSKERRDRERRTLDSNPDLVLRPQDYISEINTNDTVHNHKPGLVDVELRGLDIDLLDNFTRKRCQKISSFSVESFSQYNFRSGYHTPIEQLRGIFIFCTEFFRLIDDNGKTDFGKEPKGLDAVLHQSYCTPYELTWIFKRMANSLGIKCDLVVGFLKTPNSDNLAFKFNHCWLRVLVNDEWRLVDVILGSITNPIHDFVNNKPLSQAEDFYFLAQPLQFIYTHIPHFYQEQHIVPTVDKNVALCLPLVFPSFFRNDLEFYRFSLGLCNLKDSEIFECSIKIPNNIEVFASIVTDSLPANESKHMSLSLVQIKLRKRDRIALVKAILPQEASSGVLYIYSGLKGSQTSLDNIHPLSFIIPLYHQGKSKPYEFVTRFPTPVVQKVELYVKEPQNKYLFTGMDYLFQIIQSPYDGVMYEPSRFGKLPQKSIALESPSGKIITLQKKDHNFQFGTWEISVNVNEPGTWTGLVTADTGSAWCKFSEWTCL